MSTHQVMVSKNEKIAAAAGIAIAAGVIAWLLWPKSAPGGGLTVTVGQITNATIGGADITFTLDPSAQPTQVLLGASVVDPATAQEVAVSEIGPVVVNPGDMPTWFFGWLTPPFPITSTNTGMVLQHGYTYQITITFYRVVGSPVTLANIVPISQATVFAVAIP